MNENEQRPGSDDIDNTGDSTAEGFPIEPEETAGEPESGEASSKSTDTSERVQVTRSEASSSERTPIVRTGNDGIALVIAGIVAAIITVAFILPADSIFPQPSPEPTSQAPATATKPVTQTPATPEKTTPETPATSDEEKASDAKPADPKPADPKPAGASSPKSGASATRAPRSAHGDSLVLMSTSIRMTSSDQETDAPSSESRDSIGTRVILLIKLVILICLATVCSLVVLGGMALGQDRPLGNPRSALCRLFACSWLATLSLLVPFPVEWLLATVHYVLAAVIFWIVSMVWFHLTPRRATVLLGGTMALLAATALGARLVVWATWT